MKTWCLTPQLLNCFLVDKEMINCQRNFETASVLFDKDMMHWHLLNNFFVDKDMMQLHRNF